METARGRRVQVSEKGEKDERGREREKGWWERERVFFFGNHSE